MRAITLRLRLGSRCVACFGVALALLGGQVVAAQGTGYVFAYFEGPWPTGGDSGIYLSYSHDGLEFVPLNDGNPVLTPPQPPDFPSGENVTRDPSVVYGPDGLFHMVWTSGIEAKTIGYSSSPDLVNWSDPERVEIWGASDDVTHTWAPELYYDEQEEDYLVVFASDVDGHSHRLYSVETTDFSSFSSPELFYYNGYPVIDGMIAEDVDNDQFVMVMREDIGGGANVWMATSDTARGPWTRTEDPVVGTWTTVDNDPAEGPCLIKIDDTWHLYWDAHNVGDLRTATSTDLVNWTNRSDVAALPDEGRHGTVFAAPTSVIGWDIPYVRADLNEDGQVDFLDWNIFSANHLVDLGGLSAVEQGLAGDLDGDGDNDFLDFRLFKQDYIQTHGASAFAALVAGAVPEPSTCSLIVVAAAALLATRVRRNR